MMTAKMFLYTSLSPLARTFHLKVPPGLFDLLWPLFFDAKTEEELLTPKEILVAPPLKWP